jgi:polysaccharide export outer membrane protein
MRGVRAVMVCLVAALALTGCMQTAGPVAMAQPQSDLDSLAYGPAPAGSARYEVADSGGAVSALRKAFAAAPQRAYAPAPAAYAAAPEPAAYDTSYKLDAGDKLRFVVYGQEGLTNSYAIDAGGSITMPLIGAVHARGRTPAGLAAEITAKLRNGYIREPSVAVEIESYRPFFILGEVAAPGQYPYVPNMSVESAVAIAGGFSPRARRDVVTLTHTDGSGSMRVAVPLGTAVSPGDTVLVGERWF